MVGRFGGVCIRRGLKVNAGNGRILVLVDGIQMEHVSEFRGLLVECATVL